MSKKAPSSAMGKSAPAAPGKPAHATPGKPAHATPGKPAHATPGKPAHTTPGKPARDTLVEMTQMILPSDANPLNAAFGGRVMEWIDICGGIAAQRHCRQTVVTASMDELHFHAPIRVGWIVTLRSRVLAAFHTSMEVGVTVQSENPLTGEKAITTSALLTFVALARDGSKVMVPPLLLETEEERQASASAHARRQERLAHKDVGSEWQALVARGTAAP